MVSSSQAHRGGWNYTYFDNEVDSSADGEDDAGGGGECPVAFSRIGGRCYFYGRFKLNWFRAAEFCHSFGAEVSLACIETGGENAALRDWLVENGERN